MIEGELIWTTDPLVAAKRCLAFFVRCKLLDPNELVGPSRRFSNFYQWPADGCAVVGFSTLEGFRACLIKQDQRVARFSAPVS